MRDAMQLYGRDAKLLLIVASEAMLLAVMDTSSLIPLYLHGHLGVEIDQAARIASLFPLGMVCATFGGGSVRCTWPTPTSKHAVWFRSVLCRQLRTTCYY